MTTRPLGADETFMQCMSLYGIEASRFRRFEGNLASLGATLDPIYSLRKVSFPGYHGCQEYPVGLPDGLPPVFYYFVPNTGWGTINPHPSDPLGTSFPYCADGLGLNLGCPLRLIRALDILADLPEREGEECEEGLLANSKHLATVEELVWLDAFKYDSVSRGPINHKNKSCDWILHCRGLEIAVDVKARPALWPLQTDAKFTPMSGCFLDKAVEQFPDSSSILRVVAVTGFQEPNDRIYGTIADELRSHAEVDAVLYRMPNGAPVLISLKKGIIDCLSPLLKSFPPDSFQYASVICFSRKDRDAREIASAANPEQPKTDFTNLHFGPDLGVAPSLRPLLRARPTYPYHIQIPSRLVNDEPIFKVETVCIPSIPSRWER